MPAVPAVLNEHVSSSPWIQTHGFSHFSHKSLPKISYWCFTGSSSLQQGAGIQSSRESWSVRDYSWNRDCEAGSRPRLAQRTCCQHPSGGSGQISKILGFHFPKHMCSAFTRPLPLPAVPARCGVNMVVAGGFHRHRNAPIGCVAVGIAAWQWSPTPIFSCDLHIRNRVFHAGNIIFKLQDGERVFYLVCSRHQSKRDAVSKLSSSDEGGAHQRSKICSWLACRSAHCRTLTENVSAKPECCGKLQRRCGRNCKVSSHTVRFCLWAVQRIPQTPLPIKSTHDKDTESAVHSCLAEQKPALPFTAHTHGTARDWKHGHTATAAAASLFPHLKKRHVPLLLRYGC